MKAGRAELQVRPRTLRRKSGIRQRAASPPRGFRPLSASQAELKKLGFPKRPDPALQPAEYAFWQEMFAPPLEFEAFDFEILPLFTTRSRRILPQLPRRQTSLNWSGAYITPRDGTVFSSMWAKFQVPTPNPPSGGAAGEQVSQLHVDRFRWAASVLQLDPPADSARHRISTRARAFRQGHSSRGGNGG